MHRLVRGTMTVAIAAVVMFAMLGANLSAQQALPNDYRINRDWMKLDRPFGTMTGALMDPDGEHIWMISRCGANQCAGSDVNPIVQMDMDGNVVREFGAGWFAWPHGTHIDRDGYLWVTEGSPVGDARGAPGHEMGMGHQVHKIDLDREEIIFSLGQRGVAGCTETLLNGPSSVAIQPSTGDIWMTGSHRGGNNRLVHWSPEGEFIKQWGGCVGENSGDPGKFNDPHHVIFDRRGRLIVVDRSNNRLQVFTVDSEGEIEIDAIWTQFGSPSGAFIDKDDNLYVSDGVSSQSRAPAHFTHACCQGYEKGIYIADAETGWLTGFIPDTFNQEAGVEFIGVDLDGNIYAGYEPDRQQFIRQERFRPAFNTNNPVP